MLTITILGSGPSRSIPRAGCPCDLCRDARHGGKSARLRSSILIQNQKKSVLIDTSPDFVVQADRAKIKNIDAVFFTHEHADATGGFGDFILWCAAHKQNPQIFAEEAVIKYLRRNFKSAKNVDFVHFAPFKKIKIAGIILESFRVNHGLRNVPTLGYQINNKVIFISDFDDLPPKSTEYLRGAKTMILDAAMWFGRKIKGHNTPKEAIALAKKFNPKILYLTQTGHTWPPHDITQRMIEKYTKEQKINLPVVITYDGLKIRV